MESCIMMILQGCAVAPGIGLHTPTTGATESFDEEPRPCHRARLLSHHPCSVRNPWRGVLGVAPARALALDQGLGRGPPLAARTARSVSLAGKSFALLLPSSERGSP